MKNYAALIIDLKKSRAYSNNDRNSIQNYIMEVINTLNGVFKNSIEKEVAFSAGDEVQGLFSNPEVSYLYLRLFNMLVSPVETRAGIGLGSWDVVLKNVGTTAQDGTVYHNARHAIDNAKDAHEYSILFYSGGKYDIIINSLINSAATIINKQSGYQKELMLLSEILYPIDANGAINPVEMKNVVELLHLKNSLNYYDKQYKSASSSLTKILQSSEYKCIPSDAINDQSTFFVTSGRKRGLSTHLSSIMGISRQSIEKTIKVSNIFEIRNSVITTLKLINLTPTGDKKL